MSTKTKERAALQQALTDLGDRDPDRARELTARLARLETPKGRMLWAHVERDEDEARKAADDYREDSRNRHGKLWSVRCFPRHVRADGLVIPCWVVVVRLRRGLP